MRSRLLVLLLLAFPASLFFFSSAHAATFNVTTSACTGPGSITEAIEGANGTPGTDTVTIQAGLTVDAVGCPALGATNAADNFMFRITESVIIEGGGAGARLDGQMAWVAASGVVTGLTECPASQSGTIIIANTPGFLVVGNRHQDNSQISVTIRNLSISNLNALVQVWENAELILDHVNVSRIFDAIKCDQAAIDVSAGAHLKVLDSSFDEIINWAKFISFFGKGAITGNDAGSLEIQNSRFNRIRRAGAIAWIGAAGSTVNIVSTQIINSNGIVVLGGSTTNIVNSLLSLGSSAIDDPDDADRIINGATGPMNIRGSTILLSTTYCEPCDNGFTYPAYLQPLNGNRINLEGTALGVNVPGQTGPGELLGSSYPGSGSFSTDAFCWAQPTSQQDASTLRTIANQPGLLTDAPGLPTLAFDVYERATPIVQEANKAGLLVDAIPSASCGQANALINPVDNTCITHDVLGKDRVDSNGRRAIGAIQVNLSPIAWQGGLGDGSVTIMWSRPPDPIGDPITGYRVQYRPIFGAPTWTGGIDVLGSDNLSGTVTGLSREAYEFRVIPLVGGVANLAAASNTVAAIPYGTISTPLVSAAPGSGGAIVSWSVADTGGHILDHYVLAWKPQGAAGFSSSIIVTHPTISTGLPFLSNGMTYDIEVTAVATDGSQSQPGSTTVTPYAQANLAYPTPITLYEGYSVLVESQVSNLTATPLYVLDSGALPSGVSLDPLSGALSGTPGAGTSNASPYTATIRMSQSGLPTAADVLFSLQLQVQAVPDPLTLHYPDIDVPVGTIVSASPTVTGSATTGLVFSMVPGDSLPAGLSIDPLSGVISGTPTTASDGYRGLSVQVTNTGNANTAVSPLIVRIKPVVDYPSVTGIVGDPITITPALSPTTVAGSFGLTAGTLPAGLVLDPDTGVISGIPTTSQFVVLTITYTQTGAQTQKANAHFGIGIEGYSITATYPATSMTPGQFLTVMPTVEETKGATTFTAQGALPEGLSLDPATGIISGTPTRQARATIVAISVTDSYTQTRTSAVFEVTLQPTPAVPTLGWYGLALLVAAFGSMGVLVISSGRVSGTFR